MELGSLDGTGDCEHNEVGYIEISKISSMRSVFIALSAY